jgi:hypothetical protein
LKRQAPAGGDLRLGKGPAKVGVNAHHLARGLHLRPQDRIHVGKLGEGQDGLLDGDVGQPSLLGEAQLLQGRAQHHLGGQLGQGNPDGLAHEGNRPGCPGVHLQDVDHPVLDGELDVYQPHHAQLQGHGHRLFPDLFQQIVADGAGWQ